MLITLVPNLCSGCGRVSCLPLLMMVVERDFSGRNRLCMRGFWDACDDSSALQHAASPKLSEKAKFAEQMSSEVLATLAHSKTEWSPDLHRCQAC